LIKIWELFRTALKSNWNGPLFKSVALSVNFAVGSISPPDDDAVAVAAMVVSCGGGDVMGKLDKTNVVRRGRILSDPHRDSTPTTAPGAKTRWRWSVEQSPLIGLFFFSSSKTGTVVLGARTAARPSSPGSFTSSFYFIPLLFELEVIV
jgi:hypothetical protein